MTRVLVVEDEDSFSDAISYLLRKEGFEVAVCSTGPDALETFDRTGADLVLLDLMLPGLPGSEVCRSLREKSNVPVIMLTAKDSEIDKVVGLELGADDYVTKPFSLRELLARIRAVLRRQEAGRGAPQRDAERGRCKFGGWQLDRRTRRLTDPSGTEVTLTKGEYALLTAFVDAPQRPLSREHLLQATRVHEDVFDRSIDVQILRLRRKLETDSNAPSIIRTERGIGYVFALPVEPL